MRTRLFPLLGILLLGTPLRMQERQDPIQLSGHWVGTGTFFDKQLAMRVGAIPIAITFDDNNSGSGTIGVASLQGMQVRGRGKNVQVTARLTGPVHSDGALAKQHVVLIVTAISDSTMKAEFHLKSNGFFDPRMREGAMLLRRRRQQ
jgi:hypothetical protein